MKIYLVSTTAKCISLTAKLCENGGNLNSKPIYVFCEDKITLNEELEIASLYGGFFNIEVLTFKRYIKSRLENTNMLSQEASCMIVRKLLNKLKDELLCFKSLMLKPNLAVTIYEIISRLESAKVSSSNLNELLIKNEEKLSPALKNKIKDIYTIYKEYENYITENKIYDSNNYLALMPELVKNDENLKNAKIILSGFPSATMQREDIFRALNTITNDISAVVLGAKDSEFYTMETYDKLIKISPNSVVYNCFNDEIEEVNFIRQNLFNPQVFKKSFVGMNSKNVSIYESISPKTETKHVAKEILKEIRKGKRFKDIAVSVGSLTNYYPHISTLFKEYDIPFYVDKKTTLNEHPIYFYIINFIDLVRKGFSVEDFIKFTTSALFCTDRTLTDGLKNYVLKYALTRKALKTPFTKSEDSRFESFENLRSIAYSVYKNAENAKTAKEYVLAIKNMLESTNVYENLKTLSKKLNDINEIKYSNLNDKILDTTNNVLNEIEMLLGEEEISALDFKNLFISGALSSEIGSIPLFNDAVYVGECKDVKIKSVDVLFCMGLNGDVPFTKSDTSILTDSDLNELDGFKVVVEPKIKIVNMRERESVGVAIMSFKQKLYLSYSNITENGDASNKSEVVNYFIKMFNCVPIKESEFLKLSYTRGDISIEDFVSGYTSYNTAIKEVANLKALYETHNVDARKVIASLVKACESLNLDEFKNKIEDVLNGEVNEKRLTLKNEFFKNGYVSATALEKFFNCPYVSYVQNLLRLKDAENGQMKVYETGSLLHSVIELYVKNIEKVKDKESSDGVVEEVIAEVLKDEKYSKFIESPKYVHFFSGLKKESKRVCIAIYNSLKNSSFKPYLLEASFNDNEKFKAIRLHAKSGEYKMQGKVDRIDKFNDKIRVIDYKTGGKDVTDEAFYSGRALQLYLYLNAFINDKIKSAGAYYFPVSDTFSKKGEKNYVMRGKTIDDIDVLYATDNNLKENRSSEHVMVKLKKDGNLDARSSTLSEEEMSKYLEYAIKISENGIDEINSGFIKPTPYEGACSYCQYLGMCGFDKDNSCFRKVKNIKKSNIVKAVTDKEKV